MKKKSDVLYGYAPLRVSTEVQAQTQNGSIDAQRARIERFIENKNEHSKRKYKVDYFEEHQSAWGDKNLRRRELMAVLKMIPTGKVDFIVFESITRLTRDVTLAKQIYDLGIKNKVEIWEVESNTNYTDPSNPNLLFIFLQKALLSEVESHNTSVRVATKHREARVNSGKDTSTIPVLGLDAHEKLVGKLVPNTSELEIVKDIMKAFVKLGSYGETISYCHERGYKTKVRFTKERIDKKGNRIPPRKVGGDEFNVNSLKRLLLNDKYRGFSKFEDTKNQFPKLQNEDGYVTWKYAHGQVIEQSILDQVDEVAKTAGFTKRPRPLGGRGYAMLTGLVSDWKGNFFQTHSAKEGKYYYYVNPKNGYRISMDDLDRSVLKLLKSYNENSSALEGIVNSYFSNVQEEIGGINAKIEKLVLESNSLSNDIDKISFNYRREAAGASDKKFLDDLLEEKRRIEKELEEKINLKIALANEKEEKLQSCDPKKIKANMLKAISKMLESKNAEKRLMLKSIIKGIRLDKGTAAEVELNPSPQGPHSGTAGGKEFTEICKWWDK